MSPDPVAEPPQTSPTPSRPIAASPKLTIATVTYNAAALIERTIESIERQDYSLVEHIIIDGNSQDDTLTHIQHYLERNSISEHRHELIVRSEPDEGLYDAMNKALQLATGDYILFLNAGDTLHSPTTLSQLAEHIFAHSIGKNRPAVIYGHTDLVDEHGTFLRHRRLAPSHQLNWRHFRSGMLVCHQSFMARTDLAQQFSYQDKRYRYSADFDWCIRIMHEAERQHLSLVAACEPNGNLSIISNFLHSDDGTTRQHHQASLRERFRIMAHHYGLLTTCALHAWFILRAVIKR
ncbi:MAG: glycosyltransferase [Bacteroidaceae bacterium]|nr:glycosyltransferase [Bacteroidaceae bacterium]